MNNFIVYHTNIRSLKINLEQLEVQLKMFKIMPHIIICTEAWKSDATKLNQLHGYNMYSTSDTMNKSDGVVVFIQENINKYRNY